MNKSKLVIYGSYGYTGSLISEIAASSGQSVVLSGRNEKKLAEQASRLKLEYRKAELNHPEEMDSLLKNASVVIHCAGPFVHTWESMAEACLRNHCHYIDITGELGVLESLKSMDALFVKAGIMVMPGAGFDVVPSDCLASQLKDKMPDAESLELAIFTSRILSSRGTLTTIAEHLGSGGVVRRNGQLKRVRSAWKSKKVDFGRGPVSVVSVPWGDLSTAYTSTGIENITVYMAMKPSLIRMLKFSNLINPLLRNRLVRSLIKKRIHTLPAGPSAEHREDGQGLIWGRVINSGGETVESGLSTPEGYTLTSKIAWLIATKITAGNLKPGYQTPATAYGNDLIFEVEGCRKNE
jgi:short subunit dehydrogenase-like uncharacterized protein